LRYNKLGREMHESSEEGWELSEPMGDKESGVNNIGFLKEHFPRNNGSE
jgi:hypothetical protein